MSIHKSYKSSKMGSGSKKSTLSRYQRVEKMVKEGKLNPETDRPTGLPKTRTF